MYILKCKGSSYRAEKHQLLRSGKAHQLHGTKKNEKNFVCLNLKGLRNGSFEKPNVNIIAKGKKTREKKINIFKLEKKLKVHF